MSGNRSRANMKEKSKEKKNFVEGKTELVTPKNKKLRETEISLYRSRTLEDEDTGSRAKGNTTVERRRRNGFVFNRLCF
jgi:hypothetical protein